MKLHFMKVTPTTAFVPRGAADSIPFSSDKLPEILERFSVKPGSVEASAMNQTLKACEDPAAAGERRYCATSLESMVDFATASLGTRDVQVASTEAGAGPRRSRCTPWLLTRRGWRREEGGLPRAAVRLRRLLLPRRPLQQGLRGAARRGERGKGGGVAICHADTSGWNPRHVAFKLLKVKPGTVSICHFLPQDHVVWAPRG
ncbi:unnamed protein product [Spirodela intermedia]|uniref:BURP domain-containing protein n=1 Tax=Spirodela intermedia TaxID=51605 RepID=A0A7I8IT93_SPIIN|nr:unnamed protein product [Spirodela intermedia]CAA6661014.1 unnamed protein product [Spirodela intermedia]